MVDFLGKPLGMAEAGRGFETESDLATYGAIYQQILRAYGFCCGLTGMGFAPITRGLHPDLEVVAIRPLGQGGALHIGNFMCLSAPAAQAFGAGQFMITSDYDIIVDRSIMVPSLEAQIGDKPRLFLPKDRLYYPDPVQLGWHRAQILGRD